MTNLGEWRDGGGVVDRPAFEGAALEQGGGGVDGEGSAGDGEHVRVVDRVAEDGVGGGETDAGEGGDFSFVGWYVKDGVADDAVGDSDAGCEDSVGWDVEAADAFVDDPIAGGTDGPDFGAGGLQLADEGEQFGEDVALDLGGEELCSGGAHVGLADAAVDLHHFAADCEFGDLAGEVAFVALVEPGDCFGESRPCSMVQRMKPEPASPDQRVPSQSKTAMRGARARTDVWNSAVVRIWAACAAVLVEVNASFRVGRKGP